MQNLRELGALPSEPQLPPATGDSPQTPEIVLPLQICGYAPGLSNCQCSKIYFGITYGGWLNLKTTQLKGGIVQKRLQKYYVLHKNIVLSAKISGSAPGQIIIYCLINNNAFVIVAAHFFAVTTEGVYISNQSHRNLQWALGRSAYILLRLSECLNPIFYNLSSRYELRYIPNPAAYFNVRYCIN